MLIVITGKPQIGKSTLAQRLLQGKRAVGMLTYPVIQQNKRVAIEISDLNGRITDRAAFCPPVGKPIPNVNAFNVAGTKILQTAYHSNANFVLLDELGFLENQALAFQRAAIDLLSADKLILAVVKPMQTPFLSAVRGYASQIYHLTDNHEQLYQQGWRVIEKWEAAHQTRKNCQD